MVLVNKQYITKGTAMKLKSIKNRPIRIVEHGCGWHIEYSPADNEYIGVIDDVGPVSRAATRDDARYDMLGVICDEQAIAAARLEEEMRDNIAGLAAARTA